MAAALVTRGKAKRPVQAPQHIDALDRDNELLEAMRHELDDEGLDSKLIIEGPVIISSDVLMGKMPKADRILKRDILWKLTSTYEWKPMHVALTSVGLFLARPEEELLRDMIPLFEVLDVKRIAEVPCDVIKPLQRENTMTQRQGSIKNMKMSTLMDAPARPQELFILQVRTADNGYNSGRTYYFDARSEELCAQWLQLLRTKSDHAVVLKQAGPSKLQKLRFRLRRVYRGAAVQGLAAFLISFSFLVDIVQTEMAGPLGGGGGDLGGVFEGFEYFFTAAFALELAVNITAHFLRPFFQARARPPVAGGGGGGVRGGARGWG